MTVTLKIDVSIFIKVIEKLIKYSIEIIYISD